MTRQILRHKQELKRTIKRIDNDIFSYELLKCKIPTYKRLGHDIPKKAFVDMWTTLKINIRYEKQQKALYTLMESLE